MLKSKIRSFMHCVILSSRLLFFISLNLGKAKKNLLKKRIWHRCLPVSFTKFLRTPFLQKTAGRLLLFILHEGYMVR